jgi:hypothetical protein
LDLRVVLLAVSGDVPRGRNARPGSAAPVSSDVMSFATDDRSDSGFPLPFAALSASTERVSCLRQVRAQELHDTLLQNV